MAEHNLANAYAEARGVYRDRGETLRLWKSAAAKGIPEAESMLELYNLVDKIDDAAERRDVFDEMAAENEACLLYTSPSPRDRG